MLTSAIRIPGQMSKVPAVEKRLLTWTQTQNLESDPKLLEVKIRCLLPTVIVSRLIALAKCEASDELIPTQPPPNHSS